jgi:hypothetical protein
LFLLFIRIISFIKIIVVIVNYVIMGFTITIFSFVNIKFIAPLGLVYKDIQLIVERNYPDLSLGSGLRNFLIEYLEILFLWNVLLLSIALATDCFLRKVVDNNKFKSKDIIVKNYILRSNQKVKTIHVWSISLLVGLVLFSVFYQLGPNEYIPPLVHLGEAYSPLGAMEFKTEATSAIHTTMETLSGVLH